MSSAELPRMIPVKPPEMKSDTKAIANIIAVVKRMLPLHRVANQLNTFTADGTAIISVRNMKTDPRNGFIPVTNMWCAHTTNESKEIPNMEPIMAL